MERKGEKNWEKKGKGRLREREKKKKRMRKGERKEKEKGVSEVRGDSTLLKVALRCTALRK